MDRLIILHYNGETLALVARRIRVISAQPQGHSLITYDAGESGMSYYMADETVEDIVAAIHKELSHG